MIEINGWQEEPADELVEILRTIAQTLRSIDATLRKKAEDEHGGLVGYLQELIAMGGPEDVE